MTGLIGFEHGVAPVVTELDDTSTVVEVCFIYFIFNS